MADKRPLFDALTEFARTIVGRYEISDVLYRLTDQVVAVLGLDGAGVSVADEHDALRFVTASSADLVRIERVQDSEQQGPCASAFRTCAPVTCEDLAAETRWPKYTRVALAEGYRAVAAVPLRSADGSFGSLNLYSKALRSWEPQEITEALLLADVAASYVTNASALKRSERVREQLQVALESRIVIEQAKGVLAAREGISVDEAFQKLRRYTRSHNAKLHEIANAIVHRELRLNEERAT
jgi:GAF domain-containing protein